MRDQDSIRTLLVVFLATLAGCATGSQADGLGTKAPPEQQERLKAMRKQGGQASLTVFPVVMSGGARRDVADVVALLLEQAGMVNLETSEAVFTLDEGAEFAEAAGLFGEFVGNNPLSTDYALYVEFVGTPKTGPTEIRGIVVDKTGAPVWIDRQTPEDPDFKRSKPADPMTCCMFLAERLGTRLGLAKADAKKAGEGKFARKWAGKSGTPDDTQRKEMAARKKVMKKAGDKATVAVYPVRLSDDEVGKKDANHLARLLNKEKLCKAKAVDSPLRVKIQPARNMQKLLWDLARAFQDHVKQNPPEADYALLADYIMTPSGQVWAVHFVICDRDGEWVIVDFQNNHHDDFQSIDPKTLDDCGRLVAKRLEGYLR